MKYGFILILFVCLPAWAQYDIEEAKNSDTTDAKYDRFELKERIYVGGEIGLSGYAGGAYVLLAPIIGYDITPRFSAGISTFYQLFRFRNFNTGAVRNLSTVGLGTFARFRPIDQLIMQVELDGFNTVDLNSSGYSDRVNVPAFMAGLGYAGGGSKSYYQILLMYDFIGNPNMPLPPFILNRLHLKMGMVWHLN